jgi:cytosine/adenosine deaminase-related metal-dependent hydrolase
MFDPEMRAPTGRRGLGGLLAVATAGTAIGGAPSAQAEVRSGATLIRGAHVLTLEPGLGDIPGGDVLIRDGRIAGIGRGLQTPEGTAVIEAAGMLVMPGFVDAHTHGFISQMRGLYGNTHGSEFFPVTTRLAAHYTPEDTYVGMLLSAIESAASGITTTADFFDNLRNPDHAKAGLRAMREAPTRGRLLYGMSSKTTTDSIDLADLEAWHQRWTAISDGGRISLGVAWRLPAELDDAAAWRIKMREWETARRLGLTVQVHVSATVPDRAEAMFDALIARKLLFPGLQVIHATNARTDHLAALEASGASLVITPLTEHRVGYGLTRVDRFASISRLGFGIDGSALAGFTDMFALMRLTALTQAGAAQNEKAVQPRQLLELATSGGARALGLEAEIGTLAPGKRADLQMIRLDRLNLLGFENSDPSVLLVYSARPDDIALVTVGGRIVHRGGDQSGPDLQHLRGLARRSIAAVLKRAAWPACATR